jgi:NAD(P)-dependent dehydrogenase (short-subunit alcohol dehydrogenase family)
MSNKIAIITGSSGGIGKSLVKEYLEDNFMVIGLDKELSKISNVNFIEINSDLSLFGSNKEYRDTLCEKIVSCFKKQPNEIVIINNAAVQVIKEIKKVTYEDWESSFSVNLIAPFFLARFLIENISFKHGHIINISSIHAKLTKSNFICYSTSKAALEGLTRSLAIELSKDNISVNGIAPAAIATDMLLEGFENNQKKIDQLSNYHPANKIGQPKDLACFIKSITDHNNSFFSGSIIEYSGGISGRLHDPD